MKVLLLNQTFYPDVVATAQHLSDLADHLARAGHEVTVITGARAYDSPEMKFPRRETWKGIRIVRVGSFGLGKGARWRRALDFASFLVSCSWRLLFTPRQDVVVGLTAPPLVCFLATLFVRLKGGHFVFWVMDLNPDAALAAGWLRQGSLAARFLSAILRFSLHRADQVVVLDRFMEERILAKGVAPEKIRVISPWSQDDAVYYDPQGRAAFRSEHGLTDKFVVMYSGNHSPCHPLDTLLQSALLLARDRRIVFCFVGGGSEFAKVERFVKQHNLENTVCLPYQPLEKLAGSLSAADLQVVVMGDAFAGLVHPCKIYNVLAAGIPALYVGPLESHVTDILAWLDDASAVRVARHGAVEDVVQHIQRGADATAAGATPGAKAAVAARFSAKVLLPQMTDVLESCAGGAPVRSSERAATPVRGA